MQTNLEYKLALGYAALGGFGWLTLAFRQWTIRRRYTTAAQSFLAQGDGETAQRALQFAGARLSEALIAAALAAVFTLAAAALLRRTWNAWDWATATVGIASVLSLVMLCASGRVIVAAPFTLAPLWLLLYRPGVKAASGVATAETGRSSEVVEQREEIDLQAERQSLIGLRQSLQVYEIERGMPTDTFVARYAQGLEEDSPDNEEWFALARMARRSEERIASLNGSQPHGG